MFFFFFQRLIIPRLTPILTAGKQSVFVIFTHLLTLENDHLHVYSLTVRWSNFDRRRDPKMGVFLQSTEATACGHLLK
jgi:hypothetical protein